MARFPENGSFFCTTARLSRERLILSHNGSFIPRTAHSFAQLLVYFENGSFFRATARLFRERLILLYNGSFIPRTAHSFAHRLVYSENGSFFRATARLFWKGSLKTRHPGILHPRCNGSMSLIFMR